MEEDGFPLELAHKQHFPAIFGDKCFERKFFARKPIYSKMQTLVGGKDGEAGLILLNQGEQQVKSKRSGPGIGLVFVFFSFPDFKLLLKKSREPVKR
uniref:Uncharacterized protein n=1 Tax=Desulfobacca acetoxidans TaxID=60893 RepID=A0A7C3Z7E5_9BACT